MRTNYLTLHIQTKKTPSAVETTQAQKAHNTNV